jgi:S-DNA-T family DNA segregation ATPase FtsK/SpoIIIE
LNVAGAYIVCATVLAVALYLSTAFSFSSIQLWAPTRFAFVTALWNRYLDWQESEPSGGSKKNWISENLEAGGENAVDSVAANRARWLVHRLAPEPRRTGIERMLELKKRPSPQPAES